MIIIGNDTNYLREICEHKEFFKHIRDHHDTEHFSHFSFVELLNVPTIGNTGTNPKKFFELLDEDHLGWLESIIFSKKNSKKKKFVLVTDN